MSEMWSNQLDYFDLRLDTKYFKLEDEFRSYIEETNLQTKCKSQLCDYNLQDEKLSASR